ncbi:MAG TPA: hypothetical protein VFB08_19335 [Burkholderiales bacterium]|nr:hypothetical protein [Burkholderiales bacterium]
MKDIATIVVAIVAVGSLAKAVLEYVAQGAQKRAELFFGLEKRFWESPQFREICELLEDDAPQLSTLTFKDKLQFLGFHEEVALAMNSGLIRPEVAHYMFGYYAIRCLESKEFWKDLEPNTPYWSLFRDFASRMKKIETSFRLDNGKLRF